MDWSKKSSPPLVTAKQCNEIIERHKKAEEERRVREFYEDWDQRRAAILAEQERIKEKAIEREAYLRSKYGEKFSLAELEEFETAYQIQND